MSASRIGRMPVTIPSGVEVKVINESLLVKGPKGQLNLPLRNNDGKDIGISVDIDNGVLKVRPSADAGYIPSGSRSKSSRSIVGTARKKIFNMVKGVTTGFETKLIIVGVGYKAAAKGKVLNLTLGYSHPIDHALPEGVTAETPTPTEIILKGIDVEKVTQTAAEIRAYRGPEPYKGKGIRRSDETIIRKETKKK
jgi:large subunit ribosomal protein L6